MHIQIHTHNTDTHTDIYTHTYTRSLLRAARRKMSNADAHTVFSYYRMMHTLCSLTIKCVLLLQNGFSY